MPLSFHLIKGVCAVAGLISVRVALGHGAEVTSVRFLPWQFHPLPLPSCARGRASLSPEWGVMLHLPGVLLPFCTGHLSPPPLLIQSVTHQCGLVIGIVYFILESSPLVFCCADIPALAAGSDVRWLLCPLTHRHPCLHHPPAPRSFQGLVCLEHFLPSFLAPWDAPGTSARVHLSLLQDGHRDQDLGCRVSPL